MNWTHALSIRDRAKSLRLARHARRVVLGAFAVFGLLMPSRAEQVDQSHYHELVALCRQEAKPIQLASDKSVVCFDGQIHDDRDYAEVDGLRAGGAFVVRSAGGSQQAALKIATALERKKAVVVVYDYCLSACASYFLIAGDRAHVMRDSIVAWHYGSAPGFDCVDTEHVRTPNGVQRKLVRWVCDHLLNPDDPNVIRYRRAIVDEGDFYERRTYINDVPQSFHIRRQLLRRYDGTGRYPEVLWMWNPRHYKTALKTQVTYEAYPETQEEVDRLAARFGFGEVWHDP